VTKVSEYRGSKEFYLVLNECLEAAEHHGLVTYKQVVKHLPDVPERGNYMSSETGAMAGAISEEMVENGHPMLSALIVRTTDQKPGPGFYEFAEQLGVLEDDPETMSDEEKLAFWKQTLDEVYEYWRAE
jgi:hypothetical protein